MFSHITVGTRNLAMAAEFYDALLIPLGLKRRAVTPDDGPEAACWVSLSQPLPRFYVYMPFNREPASVGNGSMVAFLASTAEAVNVSFRAGIKCGGTDEGQPGERTNYGAGYYGAYLRDPDGNKVHVAYRGDLL
jgi:catechol 2,3-dioxygenase-like lactoylglutathione lyase family enzyme